METEITVERAVELVSDLAPLPPEEVPAPLARGRVLAEDLTAPMDQPPWPRSPLDGYALRASDSAGAGPDSPLTLPVADCLFSGDWREEPAPEGSALRIMTGAPIPRGCDCVIRQEDTESDGERVTIRHSLRPWENYCFQGEDYRKGDTLLPAGTRLDANAMGILASAGLFREDVRLRVRRRPRCALICTGDELAEQGTRPLPPGKIYSANAAALSARLEELGMELGLCLERFSDDAGALAETLRSACGDCDAVFTTGGVSVGAKDILHEALPLLRAERVFWRVELKPGSPLMYARYRGTPILCLSGNPFAAGATFELFGRPLLGALSGRKDLLPLRTRGVLEQGFPKKGGRRFVRGLFRNGRVTLPEGHSSGQLRSAAGTNCLAEIPAGAGPLAPGAEVTVWLL